MSEEVVDCAGLCRAYYDFERWMKKETISAIRITTSRVRLGLAEEEEAHMNDERLGFDRTDAWDS